MRPVEFAQKCVDCRLPSPCPPCLSVHKARAAQARKQDKVWATGPELFAGVIDGFHEFGELRGLQDPCQTQWIPIDIVFGVEPAVAEVHPDSGTLLRCP